MRLTPRPMAPEFAPPYQDLKYMAPLSQERAAVLSKFVASNASGCVLDFGCGWAELLIETLEQGHDLTAIGYDLESDGISHGRTVAEQRGVGDRLEFVVGNALESLPDQAGGVFCIGASQIWGASVEENQPLDYRCALTAIRDLLQPGLPLVFGDGIWTAQPTPEAIAPLAGRLDEFVFLPSLLEIASECGFVVMRTHQASLDEWDEFESGFTAGYARWLADNPADHPDRAEVAAKLARQTGAYYNGYREILGMAYLQLLAV